MRDFFVNDFVLGWAHQEFCVSGRLPYGELFFRVLRLFTMRLCLTLGYLGSSHSQPKKVSRYTVHTITFRRSRAARCSQSGYVEHVMFGSIRIRIPHRRTSLIKYHLTGMTCRISVSLTLSYIIKPCACEPDPIKPHAQNS